MTTRTIINRKGHRFTVLLDDEDAHLFDAHRWYVSKQGYLVRSLPDTSKERFHRLIVNAPDDMQVDHCDRNRLNNCKDNLRLCSSSENARNRTRGQHNTSGYVGVKHRDGKRWEAELTVHGRLIYLGSYSSPMEAAAARDKAALEHHGDFANLNLSDLVLSS